MKKIGILTYHHALNYGTLLQAYATEKIIEKEGYEAEFINYQQRNKYDFWYMLRLRLKRIPSYIFGISKYYYKSKAKKDVENWKVGMREFTSQRLKEGKHLYIDVEEIENNPPIYDGYIIGSDQTWNQNITNNTDALYLSFVKDPQKKGSYAPSVGVSELTEAQKKRYVRLLSDFRYLSCREKTGSLLLSEILKRNVECVLDPTLMMNKEEWISFSQEIAVERPYILTYFLGETRWYREFAKKISDNMSLRIVNVPTNYLDYSDKESQKEWVNPQEFVYLINHAELVMTDSFHGTVLSINMNKRFYSFIKNSHDDVKSQSSRIVDVLNMLGLTNRLLGEETAVKMTLEQISQEIDYKYVNACLEIERSKSLAYLKRMLIGITE